MEALDDFYGDPENRGIASGAELAQLLGCSEGYVREFGRGRATRRVGSTLVYDREDAEELLQHLDEDEEAADAELDDEDEELGDEEE